jgi:hypothetical protein
VNTDRRQACEVTIALLVECHHVGLISDESHVAVTNMLHHLQRQEFWQLKNQEKHEGKNASTDTQLAICRVALPALDAAIKAWDNDDFDEVIRQLSLASTTDGSTPKKTSGRGLRKARG